MVYVEIKSDFSEKRAMKANRFLLFTTILLLMLVTGVFWGTWFTISRSIEGFDAGCFLAIGKTIIANVAWPMRILMPLTLLLMLWTCIVHPQKATINFTLYLMAFLLLVTVLLITLIVLVPLDNQFKVWTLDNIPNDWGMLRDKWEYFHTWRTFLSLGSFACFTAAVIGPK